MGSVNTRHREQGQRLTWHWHSGVGDGAVTSGIQQALLEQATIALRRHASSTMRVTGRYTHGWHTARQTRLTWSLRQGLLRGCDLELRIGRDDAELIAEPASRLGQGCTYAWTAIVVSAAMAGTYLGLAEQLPQGRAALPALAVLTLIVAPLGGVLAALLAYPFMYLLNRAIQPRRMERSLDIARGAGAVVAGVITLVLSHATEGNGKHSHD